jgi:hypothetical protein
MRCEQLVEIEWRRQEAVTSRGRERERTGVTQTVLVGRVIVVRTHGFPVSCLCLPATGSISHPVTAVRNFPVRREAARGRQCHWRAITSTHGPRLWQTELRKRSRSKLGHDRFPSNAMFMYALYA